ncbi:MAG: hypothetical protein WD275_04540 [Rhodothermales bacterium]
MVAWADEVRGKQATKSAISAHIRKSNARLELQDIARDVNLRNETGAH